MDKDTVPTVSVVMPVYNCDKYILESVNSILNQTYADFELIIIDDASTDNTLAIIELINDNRIRLRKKHINTGLTNSLNMGLKLSKGKYVARMDGDDISLPERFEKQVKYLSENSDVAACGTWYQIAGSGVIQQHPSESEEIKLALLECCSLGHPTVMFRKSVTDDYNLEYDTNMEPAEDYDLWVRIIKHKKIINIPEVLLTYRLHKNQVSAVRALHQRAAAQKARIKLIGNLYNEIPLINITEPINFGNNPKENKEQLLLFIKEIETANRLNIEKGFFSKQGFTLFLDRKKRAAIQGFFNHPHTSGWKYLYFFLFSEHSYYRNFKNRDKLKVIYKSLFYQKLPKLNLSNW